MIALATNIEFIWILMPVLQLHILVCYHVQNIERPTQVHICLVLDIDFG